MIKTLNMNLEYIKEITECKISLRLTFGKAIKW